MGILDSLIQNESGGRWDARNNAVGAGGKVGHFGRLQFGQARLQDAINAGVAPKGMTPDQFMANPALQQKVETWHFKDIDAQAEKMGLNRFIGQNVGGVRVTPQAIRSMAHLGGIGGAAKFLQSGGKYNPADINGTRLSDYGQRHGGGKVHVSTRGGDMRGVDGIQGGGGLLSIMGGAGADKLQSEPKTWADRTIKSQDWRQRLAIALQGLTLNPNVPFMQMLSGEIQGRKDEAMAQQAQAKQQAQVNRTVEWLRANGQETLAQALETGAVDAGAVVNQAMQAMQPPKPQEATALQQNVEWLQSQGVPLDRAIEMARGGTTVNVGQDSAPVPQLLGTSGLVAIPDPSSPQGWRVEPAQGSPLAADAEKAESAAKVAAGAKNVATQTIVNAAQRAREAAQSSPLATGIASRALQYVPNTPAAEIYRQVDVLKSQAKIENLNAMRAASPTGGALGSVTESETAMLAAKSGALDPSSPNFQRDLDDYELTLLTTIHGPDAGKKIYESSRPSGASVAPVTIQNDAEYDALPSGTEFIGPDGVRRRKP